MALGEGKTEGSDAPASPSPASVADTERVEWQRRYRRLRVPYKIVLAASLILTVCGVGAWRLLVYQSGLDKGLLILARAYGRMRPVRARTTLPAYAPFGESRGTENQGFDATEVERAKTLLFLAASSQDPTSEHALGLLYLTQGNRENAIGLLRSAVSAKPNCPTFHNDLGAAILEKALEDHERSRTGSTAVDASIMEFDESLAQFRKALELDPRLPAALFNRGLCRQAMDLRERAREDWTEYLKLDSTSGWASEARAGLDRLDQNSEDPPARVMDGFISAFRNQDETKAWQLLTHYRDANGSQVENDLLTAYLQTRIFDDAREAAAKMDALAYAGALESGRAGDHFELDLLHWYRRATPTAERSVLRARLRMAQADKLAAESNKYAEALGLYEEAVSLFTGAGDVCETKFAEYREGRLYLRLSRPEAASAVFERLRPFSETRHYKWLLGQCLLGLADAHLSLADYSKAIACSEAGLRLIQDAGDINSVIFTLSQLGIEYRAVGKRGEALAFLQRSLGMVREPGAQPRNVWLVYMVTGATCDSLGLVDTALDYYREASRAIQEKTEMTLYISRSKIFTALALGKLGSFNKALECAESSFDIGKKSLDLRVGKTIMARSCLAMGEIYRSANRFDEAIRNYDEAMRYYQELNQVDKLLGCHRGRFLAFVAAQDGRAGEELNEALALYEQSRAKILEESNKETFFEEAQDIYDIAIEFVYSKAGDPWGAFDLAELSRARSFNDLIKTGGRVVDKPEGPDVVANRAGGLFSLDRLQKRIPDNFQVVEYSVLTHSLLIWVVSVDSRFSINVDNVSVPELSEKITRYLSMVASPTSDQDAEDLLAQELFDVLIGPVRSHLDPNKELCIVPDKLLNYLPFHALRSRTSGSYLLEDYSVSYSPSANTFISQSALAKVDNTEESLLAVGNPTFDHSLFKLSSLGGATREAQTIGRNYAKHIELLGPSARKGTVVEQMQHADVIELATHCIIDQMSALRSCLLLAKEPGISPEMQSKASVLQAREVYDLRLPHARLVVLSGCSTAIERSYKGEGPIGMARPFLVAGASQVVASLWAVDSESAADLLVDFHRIRKQEGRSTAEALRRAQHDKSQSEGHWRNPYYWASFIVIGSSAKF